MKPVKMIQFLRPNGRQVPVETDLPDNVADRANAIIATGYRFEIEELRTGEIHVTISAGDDDIVGILAPNGPGLHEAIADMIAHFEYE